MRGRLYEDTPARLIEASNRRHLKYEWVVGSAGCLPFAIKR